MDAKNSLKTLKHVLQLVERYKLDSIKFNGIEITKSKHVMNEATPKKDKAATHYSFLPTSNEELDRDAMNILGIGV